MGDVDQRFDVFREAGAAVATACIDEVVANALVRADTQAHILDIHIEALAEAGNLVHEGDFGRQHGIGCVLGHFRIANAHEHGSRTISDEGCVQRAHDLTSVLVVSTDNDAVRVHEVVDRRTFLEEFRVGDD